MLKIAITPTSLVFEDLTDDLHITLIEKFDLQFILTDDGYAVTDEPQYLYKLLHRLSYDYDIELV